MSNLRRAAVAYAELGWAVFPCWWPVEAGVCACWLGERCDRVGKHPLRRNPHPKGSPERATCRGECGREGHGLWDASADPAVAERRWTQVPHANIGVNDELSGLAILDVDPKNGGLDSLMRLMAAVDLPDTLTATTGSGGRHIVYAGVVKGAVAGPSTKHPAFGPDMAGLDVKSAGGYTIAPPSVHGSGNRYRWDTPDGQPGEVTAWPEVLTAIRDQVAAQVRAARQPVRPGRFAPRPGSGYGAAALAGVVRDFLEVPADRGLRNDALNAAAYRCGQLISQGHITEMQARRELEAAATAYAAKDGWAAAQATINSGLPRGMASVTDLGGTA